MKEVVIRLHDKDGKILSKHTRKSIFRLKLNHDYISDFFIHDLFYELKISSFRKKLIFGLSEWGEEDAINKGNSQLYKIYESIKEIKQMKKAYKMIISIGLYNSDTPPININVTDKNDKNLFDEHYYSGVNNKVSTQIFVENL